MATSPDIDNYQIPTGVVSFKPTGEASFINLGNCVNFSISNEIEKKEHFRNYGGRRTKDKTSITQVAATVNFTLDEITGNNISYFALAEVLETTDGTLTMKGLSKTTFEGTLKVVGDNTDGPQLDWEGDVSFVPSADFSFIKDNDDWNVIQIEADVQEDDDGDFGTWTYRSAT